VVNDGLTLPLEVLTPAGKLLAVLLMNAKAANKSRERGELWTVVPGAAVAQANPVLSIDGAGFTSLEVVDGCRYRAVLADTAAVAAVEAAVRRFAGLAAADLPDPPSAVGRQPTLEVLKQVIAGRRRDLPEGSYTTLLFQKGEDKIRKKTGEEAIELLLATSRKDIVAEAADLIYHMMVLLEVKDIGVDEVLAELEGRMK
jgi:phosphoribosyl-ATP pyrophosphohydrolase